LECLMDSDIGKRWWEGFGNPGCGGACDHGCGDDR
jgi:hypothetical protein